MCKVIAVSNQKGGVGKTVSCVNLGIGLAQEGKKVLLIDGDPQGSLTISLGYEEPDEMEYSLATLMMNIVNDEKLNIEKTILHHKEGVDLIPANIELSAIEVSLVNAMSRELILKSMVEKLRDFYDFIIIDCMPSLGMMTINALACADSVLIPVQAAYLPVKGLQQLIKTIGRVKKQLNPKLKIEGILLTMVDNRTNYARDISLMVYDTYSASIKVFGTEIPMSVRASEVSVEGGSIYSYDPKGKAAFAYMDINMNYSDDDNPIALKADFILSLCELIVGNKDGLRPVEKTVIDRCIRQIYQKYFENPGPENMPILGDLYQALLAQEEPEAKHVATALEIYVSGSLNVFNHRTNVELTNRLVCYDIKNLGKQLKKIGMLVVQDQVWGRVTENRSQGRSTRYYMDEMHLLLREDQTAAYTVEIWKRFRKWGGIPTGITQNVKDLLASKEVENIFENSDFIYMLNQAVGDRQILAKQLNISPHQLSYVTHSGEGEGLLFYGNVILPFVDRFPTNTELYRIMTTRLSEVAEAKKEQSA